MTFSQSDVDLYVPDGTELSDALNRSTHLAVGAHQDDIEIIAYHGIAACFGRDDRHFTGVVVTDGAGSARAGVYEKYTDEEMMDVRRREQRKAAEIGEYSAMIQLGHPSATVKNAHATQVTDDIHTLLSASRPEVVYLHNPADKHDTHVAVMVRSLEAIRRLPAEVRPEKVYGCEVWRSLDWLPDDRKTALPVEERENIAAALVSLFDSQISGGKRYDLATAGRRRANATYYESHATDTASAVTFAMDLTPLVADTSLSIEQFTCEQIDHLRDEVRATLRKVSS